MSINKDRLIDICNAMANPNPNIQEIESLLNRDGLSIYGDKEKQKYKSVLSVLNEISDNLGDDCFAE